MRRIPLSSMIAVLLAAGVAACRAPASVSPQPITDPPMPRTDAAAIARARADSARYPYVAADVSFMTGMIGHHAQAIDMARLAPARGASAAILRLAERIINAQQDEIFIMQQWLLDRQQPVPRPRPGVAHGSHDHGAMMPGMLTPEQVRQLEAARGAEFDRLFLTFMIQHHRGAVAMVKELFSSYGAGQDETVFKFASDVNVDQTTEIARMELMLAELTSTQRNQP